MQTLRILLLLLVLAWNVRAQTAVTRAGAVDAAAQVAALKAPLRTAADEADKASATLQTWYVSGLDQLQNEAVKAGDLDGVVAIKAERERIVARAPTGEVQVLTMPAPLRRLRGIYDASLKKLTEDAARRDDLLRRKYLADLEALQKQITMTGNIEQALLVKAEKDRVSAQIALAAPAAAANRPGAVKTPASPTPLPLGVRLAESMTLYASGNNGCLVHINGKEEMKAIRDAASKVSRRLHEGDIIAIRLSDRFDINSFWFSAVASTGEFLFETSEQWISYIPADTAKWWNTKNARDQKPAQFAPDSQEYVTLVKRSASQTPLYRGAQPIRSVLSDGTRIAYLFYVVKKVDLVPKNDRKVETK